MARNPAISVLIACYQQGDLLGECLQSVMEQDLPCEAVVVNDGSTDSTSAVAQRFVSLYPDRVRLIEQANRGLSAARQAAWLAARGEWLLCLDADDLLEPGALGAVVSSFSRDPSAAAVVGDAVLVAADGKTILSHLRQTSRDAPWPPPWPDVLRGNPFPAGMAVAFRRDIARQLGGLEVPWLTTCEDWDLWARMIRCGCRFLPLSQVLGRYRQHPDSLSRRPLALALDKIAILDRAAGEDERLAASGLAPAPPIGGDLRNRLANLHLAYSLGLLGSRLCRHGLPTAGFEMEREGLLERVVARAWPAAEAAEFFLWGWHHGWAGSAPSARRRLLRRQILHPLNERLLPEGVQDARRLIEELILPPPLLQRFRRRLLGSKQVSVR